jgi:TolB-like protein/tetratricopeptide (TPR) repeat protein
MALRMNRKLAAILAIDIVGYSRLVELDEAGTLVRVKAHRFELIEPLVAEYHGRVVKLTGDGALVEFASAVNAVECAVAVQNGMAEHEVHRPEDRRIRFRIGINIGDIVLEDGDIYGDGVNIAVRLEHLAEPGGVCVARNVYDQVRAKVAFGFEPMGKHQVKNISEPVEVYRVGRGPRVAAGAAPSLPDKPSIAVLPLDNLSGEVRYERLADGITEDIITDLSRFRELFVVASHSGFAYKDKSTDVRQIARELGVQYILEGSLQADGERVRITAQLVDGTTGSHLWAQRYDRPLHDVFAVQDEVTQSIMALLPGQYGVLARAGRESARRKPPDNLEAYDYYLLGVEAQHRFTKYDNKKAQNLFQTALNIDHNFARVYVALAWSYSNDADNDWGSSWQQTMDSWLRASQNALALDPYDGEAHATLSMYYQYLNDLQAALAELDKALELNPNNADILAIAVWILDRIGQPERALQSILRAIRLNPHHPDWYYSMLRDTYFHNKQFEDCITASKRKLYPSPILDPLFRALSYAQLGSCKEAAREVVKVTSVQPDYSAEKWLSDTGIYARANELDLFLDSVESAGLPICATEAQLAKYPDMKRLQQCEEQRASG